MTNALPLFRPYQREVAKAVLDSVFHRKGITFSVEIARQGGKNELSAQLELLLLTLSMNRPENLIKCSPTFKPQTVISMLRLKGRLNDAGFAGKWLSEMGYIIRLGESRIIFLSAEESASVVGNTAHLLLEVDESQDVSPDKYAKDFKPMGATTNVTTVHYGTTWDEATLLEQIKQDNLELEKKDGTRRHFRFDWQDVAKFNRDYLSYVEGERQRLGEDHPLFLTQYRLLPVRGGGGFFSLSQRAQLAGEHARRKYPVHGKTYIAGIDLAGESETDDRDFIATTQTRHDSTVVTIGELDYSYCGEVIKYPRILIVEHYSWTGVKHPELYPQLLDILKNVWHCGKVVVDATGVGEPVASFLHDALGNKAVRFKFTAPSKSELGFNLLSTINSGRLKMYAGDGSPEFREFWYEVEKTKSIFRTGRTMNFYVVPSQGHDDFIMSLALLVEAAGRYQPREAKGRLTP